SVYSRVGTTSGIFTFFSTEVRRGVIDHVLQLTDMPDNKLFYCCCYILSMATTGHGVACKILEPGRTRRFSKMSEQYIVRREVPPDDGYIQLRSIGVPFVILQNFKINLDLGRHCCQGEYLLKNAERRIEVRNYRRPGL